jgi:ABC-type dipeptide/oligopeptide/nickel transport systems, permease components
MGYFGGWFDTVASRIVEAILALPFVIIAFLFAVASARPSVGSITVIIGLVFTPLIARTVRTAVLVERHQDYVSASRLLGESPARVMFGEMPNVLPAIVVEFTVRLAYAVFALVTLSFLGFGIKPPTPGLGRGHRGQLQRPAGRLLVADAVPGARHRLAGDRGRLYRGLD